MLIDETILFTLKFLLQHQNTDDPYLQRIFKERDIIRVLARFGVSDYNLLARLLNKDATTMNTTVNKMDRDKFLLQKTGNYITLTEEGKHIAALITSARPNAFKHDSVQLEHVLGIQKCLADVMSRYTIPSIDPEYFPIIITGLKKKRGYIYPDFFGATRKHYHWIENDQQKKSIPTLEKSFFLKCNYLRKNPSLLIHNYCDSNTAAFWRSLKEANSTRMYQHRGEGDWEAVQTVHQSKVTFSHDVKQRFRVICFDDICL